MSYPFKPNPKLDLTLERFLDAPRELLWLAWTTPEHVKQWFTPKPWIITDCEIDLQPGGRFRTRMQSPDGKEVSDRHCCYLEIVPTNGWCGPTRCCRATGRPASPSSPLSSR